MKFRRLAVIMLIVTLLTLLAGFSPVQVRADATNTLTFNANEGVRGTASKKCNSGPRGANLLNEPSKPAISADQVLVTIYAKPRDESDNHIFAYVVVKKGTSFEDANLPIPELSAEGYGFREWQDSKGNWYEEDDEFEITSDMTLYPSFGRVTMCTVTFDFQDTTFNGKSTYSCEMTEGTPLSYALEQAGLLDAQPVRKGFSFSGWVYGTKTYTQEQLGNLVPTGTVTIRAAWKVRETTFQLVSRDGLKTYGSCIRVSTDMVGDLSNKQLQNEEFKSFFDEYRNLVSEVPHIEYAVWTYLDGNKKGRAVESTDLVADLGASVIRVYPEYRKVPVTVNTGIYAEGAAAGSKYRANNPDIITFKTYWVPADTTVGEMWNYFELPRAEYINKYLSKSGCTFDGWLSDNGTRLKDSDDIYEGMVMKASYSPSSEGGSAGGTKVLYVPTTGGIISNQDELVYHHARQCLNCGALVPYESQFHGDSLSPHIGTGYYIGLKSGYYQEYNRCVYDSSGKLVSEKKVYGCGECGHMFSSLKNVEAHIKSHWNGTAVLKDDADIDNDPQGGSGENNNLASGGFPDVTQTSVNKTSYNAIYWAVDEGIVKGYPDGLFKPEVICTREQFSIMLWRFGGQPSADAGAANKFSDVSSFSNSTSKKAVGWAVRQGIVKGFSDGSFRPKESITRAQVAVMLWRYAGEPAAGGSSKFSDIGSFSANVQEAIIWLEGNKIASGYSDGTFRPDGGCQRQHMAIFLYRYSNNIK